MKTWETRHLRYNYELQSWAVETDYGDMPITPGDGQWALFTPWGLERPWSKGTWRACANWALLKHYARRDWARQGELAGGLRTAEVPDQAKDSDRRQLAHDLEDIGSDAVLIPPPGYKAAIVQAAANTFQTFLNQIQVANQAIAVANKGESLTSGTDGSAGLGGAGLGRVQQDVSDQRIFFIAKAWEEFLYEQILYPWAVVNFGRTAPIPRARYQTEREEDLAIKARRWTETAAAIGALRAQGLPIDIMQIADDGAIPLLPEGQSPLPLPAPPGIETPTPPAQLDMSAPKLFEAPSHEGVMIALYPSPDVAEAIALPIEGAEPAAELHITLGYYGRQSDLTPEQLSAITQLAIDLSRRPHLTGKIAGTGVFSGEEARVLWAAVDVPDLDLLRADLVRRGHELGVPPKAEHGYTPHMTLAYVAPDSLAPASQLANFPLHFPTLSLVAGGERYSFPFSTP
jgi:2'-5' RNA ligase